MDKCVNAHARFSSFYFSDMSENALFFRKLKEFLREFKNVQTRMRTIKMLSILKGEDLKSYLVLDFTIKDLNGFIEYVEKIPMYLDKYSAKYLVEGVVPEIIEGSWEPNTLVILEFSDENNVNGFLTDPEVKELFKVRHENTEGNLIKVNGGSWRDSVVPNA
ncbi:MAG: DUF1330 domain-containing protein [Vibrio sp.]